MTWTRFHLLLLSLPISCDQLVCRLGPGWWKMAGVAMTFLCFMQSLFPPQASWPVLMTMTEFSESTEATRPNEACAQNSAFLLWKEKDLMKLTPGSSLFGSVQIMIGGGQIRADLRKNEAGRGKGKREDRDHVLWGAQRSRGWRGNIPAKSI